MDRDPKGELDDTLAAGGEKPALTDPMSATVAAPSSAAPAMAADSRSAAVPSWPSASGGDPQGRSALMRYTLGAVLGRGGMGEVVSARDEQIGRSVAIKRMRATDPTPEQTARFLREAKIQGRLEHPAIVPVHELWHDDRGQPYFVMKQLTGTTLADVLDKLVARDGTIAKQYTRQALLRAFVDVCLAVEFAHTKGVVHRDLKPANIVLGDFGEVYILDWGIARVLDDDPTGASTAVQRASFRDVSTLDDTGGTVVGALLGTPGYMSPEQVRGEADLDARSDVYALGCILFELLTFEPLHSRGQSALVTTLDGQDAAASRRAPEAEIAPELDAICLAATMLERADRYATARELGEAVQRFLDGDRDVALRRELASTELAAARRALEVPSEGARRTAMRAAARALALDPTAREPAELVGKLMLEPPTEVPTEVEHEMAAVETESIRAQARLAIGGVAAYFMFFPVLYLAGMRSLSYYVVGVAAVLVQLASTVLLASRPTYAVARLAFVTNIVAMIYFSRTASPFLIGSGLAVLSAMAFATLPHFSRGWVVSLSSFGAVLAPLAVERLGWIERHTDVAADALVSRLPAVQLNGTATLVGLVLFIVIVVSFATLMARTMALKVHATQRTLHLQAWQLRQLVPRAETAT